MLDAVWRNRARLQRLAADFKLKYNSKLFKFVFVTKRQHVLISYLAGCPADPYRKYGMGHRARLRSLDKFLASKDFAAECRKPHGSVPSAKYFGKVALKLKDSRLRRECLKIARKLRHAQTPWGSIILARPDSERERKFLFNTILLHEWVHVLLFSNKISFQRIKKKHWRFDEGLATYMAAFAKGPQALAAELQRCRAHLMEKKPGTFRLYAAGALKIARLLSSKRTPKQRQTVHFNIYA